MELSSKFQPVSASSNRRFEQQNPPPASNNAQQVLRKGGSTILAYPKDIGDNPRFANYMLFTTYSMTPAKVKPVKPIMKQAGSPGSGGGGQVVDKVATAKAQDSATAAKLDAAFEKMKGRPANRSFLVNDNIPQSKTTIALYMPASVNAKYNMDFQESEIGVMSEAVMGVIKQLQSGAGVGAALGSQAGNLGTGAMNMGLNMLNQVLPGAKDLVAIERGTIIAPRVEVMFRGIGKRSFEFQFTMIPKNEDETKQIYNIVREFKRAMTPSFRLNGSVRELSFPDQFQIAYMHIDKENTFLNKIGRCYLESADVTYGGDKFITHEPLDIKGGPSGAPPSKVALSLSFKEIETMDRSRIEQGH